MTANAPAPAPPDARCPAGGLLRLLVFNAQNAGPDRARRQAEWIAAQDTADLLILTETGSGPGGDALTGALAGHGYHSIIAPRPDGTRDYRTVLASRGPALTPVPSGISDLPHRAPAATLTAGDHEVALLGLYVPSRGPRERRNEAKRAFQAAVSAALPAFTARFAGPVIAAGDLNVVEPGHQPHYRVFGTWEYDFYRAFAEAGMTDAYRNLHPGSPGHSWIGRGGNGYRFDHAFVTSEHAGLIGCCDYLHEPRTGGLTDHAALAVTIATAATAAGNP